MSRHSTEYDGCGIYALLNNRTHEIYIGKSSNIKKRFAAHRTAFRLGNTCSRMYHEPIDSFSFLVLYKCSKSEYAKFSFVLEELYMIYFIRMGFCLYNRSPHDPFHNILPDLLSSFNVSDNVGRVFENEYGVSKVHYYLMRGKGFNYLKASPEE